MSAPSVFEIVQIVKKVSSMPPGTFEFVGAVEVEEWTEIKVRVKTPAFLEIRALLPQPPPPTAP